MQILGHSALESVSLAVTGVITFKIYIRSILKSVLKWIKWSWSNTITTQYKAIKVTGNGYDYFLEFLKTKVKTHLVAYFRLSDNTEKTDMLKWLSDVKDLAQHLSKTDKTHKN